MTISVVQDNPYRVLGVCSQVSLRNISSNHKKMMTEVIKGKEIHLSLDLASFMKEPLRTPRRLDQAKSQLLSARGRILYAMFWFVDTNKLDHAALYYLTQGQRENAVKILQSQQSFSSYINLAVLALIEDRFDDAATLYSRCLQDEDMTQAFVQQIIGDKFKVKGAFLLSKVLDVLNKEKENKEREDSSDERSFAGAGYGVRNKEAQAPKTRVNIETPHTSLLENLNLKKQAGSFDRHLTDALNGLIERIALINRESGIEDDFFEVELNPNPAAQMVLEEVSHFLAINNSVIEAFRQRCYEARERSLYLDYVYNLISVVNYSFHLYATELGRQYSPYIVQQLRSIIAKLERLYFRLKSDDLDYFISSLRRIEDALPYYYAIANNFEKYYLLSDDKNLINNFYEFHRASSRVVDQFSVNFGLKGSYIDCSLHLQDMVVRYNVSFMLVMVNLALRHPYRVKLTKNGQVTEQELKVDESSLSEYTPEENSEYNDLNDDSSEYEAQNAQDEHSNQDDGYDDERRHQYYGQQRFAMTAANMGNDASANESNDGNKQTAPKLTKEQKKLLKKQEREKNLKERKRSSYFKRKLSKQRNNFINILERYQSYYVSEHTMTLLEITMRQVKRLPPPVSAKGLVWGLILIGIAGAAVYLNIMFN